MDPGHVNPQYLKHPLRWLTCFMVLVSSRTSIGLNADCEYLLFMIFRERRINYDSEINDIKYGILK